MIWIIWTGHGKTGYFKWTINSWRITDALVREDYEVWEIDMSDRIKKNKEFKVNTLNLEELEKEAILKALELNRWSQLKASVDLGLSPRALNYKIGKHGILNESTSNDGRSRWTKYTKQSELDNAKSGD